MEAAQDRTGPGEQVAIPEAAVEAAHIQCEDCGKCRAIHEENWCGDCEYWSCERGPHCADTAKEPTK